MLEGLSNTVKLVCLAASLNLGAACSAIRQNFRSDYAAALSESSETRPLDEPSKEATCPREIVDGLSGFQLDMEWARDKADYSDHVNHLPSVAFLLTQRIEDLDKVLTGVQTVLDAAPTWELYRIGYLGPYFSGYDFSMSHDTAYLEAYKALLLEAIETIEDCLPKQSAPLIDEYTGYGMS